MHAFDETRVREIVREEIAQITLDVQDAAMTDSFREHVEAIARRAGEAGAALARRKRLRD